MYNVDKINVAIGSIEMKHFEKVGLPSHLQLIR